MSQNKGNISSVDLSGFNWGAFFLSFVWGVLHKSYYPYCLIFLVPIVYMIGVIYAFFLIFIAPNILPAKIFALVTYFIVGYFCGINGNRDAYKNNVWNSLDEKMNIIRNTIVMGGTQNQASYYVKKKCNFDCEVKIVGKKEECVITFDDYGNVKLNKHRF